VRWIRRAAQPASPPAGGATFGEASDDVDQGDIEFACSSCGRTDLLPAGDFDPPICSECTEEINFAAIEEVEITQDW
jgi:hypothetical protein